MVRKQNIAYKHMLQKHSFKRMHVNEAMLSAGYKTIDDIRDK